MNTVRHIIHVFIYHFSLITHNYIWYPTFQNLIHYCNAVSLNPTSINCMIACRLLTLLQTVHSPSMTHSVSTYCHNLYIHHWKSNWTGDKKGKCLLSFVLFILLIDENLHHSLKYTGECPKLPNAVVCVFLIGNNLSVHPKPEKLRPLRDAIGN